MGCPKIAYSLYSKPALRCVHNAASRQENYARERKDEFRTGMTGLGTYDYHTTKVHAVEYIDNTGGLLNTRKQTIEYNAFNKATVLIDTVNNTSGYNIYRLDITYGPDQQRWKTVLKKNNAITKTVLFAGDYERITKSDTVTHLYYMKGGIYVKQIKGSSTTLKDGMYYTRAHLDVKNYTTEFSPEPSEHRMPIKRMKYVSGKYWKIWSYDPDVIYKYENGSFSAPKKIYDLLNSPFTFDQFNLFRL